MTNRHYIACRVAAFELGALIDTNYREMNFGRRRSEREWADFFGFEPDAFHTRHMFIEGYRFAAFRTSYTPNELRAAARKAIDDLHQRLNAAGVQYVGQRPKTGNGRAELERWQT